jgi:hypothetical protein
MRSPALFKLRHYPGGMSRDGAEGNLAVSHCTLTGSPCSATVRRQRISALEVRCPGSQSLLDRSSNGAPLATPP